MKLSDLITTWKKDSKFDLDLSLESQRIYDLHSKYLDLYTSERMALKILQLQLRKLELDKHEFLLQGASKETNTLGWVYPTSGRIIRQDIDLYKAADKELQELQLKEEQKKVLVDALQNILQSIKDRGYIIGNAIRREIFMGGQ